MAFVARHPARYARISDDQAGDEHGVKNQLAKQAARAASQGMTVTDEHTYVDNDISATYGAPRPGYNAMMRAVARGEIGVILVVHTSRLWRNRKERAEGIELLRKASVSVWATEGPSLDMSTASGRGLAGLLGEFDTMESEIKSERQVIAAQARAAAGLMPTGVRAFGFTTDGQPLEVPAWCEVATRCEVCEAGVVREMFARFHAGDSLTGIARWLNETGVPARHGGSWRSSTVRQILDNPRYKGVVIYRHRSAEPGKPVPAAFPAIVSEDVWDAVNLRLADPRRKTAFETARKHLGSSVYQCGTCGRPVRSHGSPRRYGCPDGHVNRLGGKIDDLVTALVRARLSRPDITELAARPGGREAETLTAEIRGLRSRIARTDQDYDDDLIDATRHRVKKEKLSSLLAVAEARRARLLAGAETAGVLLAGDPAAAFTAAPLGVQQAVIRFLMTVELHHVPRGKRFTVDSVTVTPKHPVTPGEIAVMP